MYLDGTLSLLAALLPLLDNSSMVHSLEARVPLRDHRLVELVRSLPGADPRRGAQGIVRLIAARLCFPRHPPPAQGGFAPPLGAWDAHRLATPLRRLLATPAGLADVLDPSSTRQWVVLLPRRRGWCAANVGAAGSRSVVAPDGQWGSVRG